MFHTGKERGGEPGGEVRAGWEGNGRDGEGKLILAGGTRVLILCLRLFTRISQKFFQKQKVHQSQINRQIQKNPKMLKIFKFLYL
jgi:hypothetical protein